MISIAKQAAFSSAFIMSVKKLRPLHLFIVTDSIVGRLYGQSVKDFLASHGLLAEILNIPAGEIHKTRQTKEYLEDQMLKCGASRQSCIIALGGGVVLDIAGFLASTFARGVPIIMLPTSLLAMVDASIGGKTGVNTSYGKNLIGTIYQPSAIFIDCDFLHTLPLDELKNGIVEMIKHALILDYEFFQFLETHAEALLSLNIPFVEQAIAKSIAIKMAVVKEDLNELGKRRLLNFGHTVGHAIETASNYTISHGRAVALGIMLESDLAVKMGYLKESERNRIKKLFAKFEIETSSPFDSDELYNIMCMDKKSLNAAPRYVVLKEIGACESFDGEFCMSMPKVLQ